MKDFKGFLPGMFTAGNMACGFGSILISSSSHGLTGAAYIHSLNEAVWLIILAAFLDFLDGLVARISKTSSRFGVELDSLADIISFCLAPAVILVNYSLIDSVRWSWILGFLFLMAGAYRLARFNLSAELEQKKHFVGLPVPMAAAAIVSYTLFSMELWGEIRMERFFVILVLSTSVLMVSTVEFETMPHFDFSRRKNRVKMVILILVAIGVMINASVVIFPVILLYISYGILRLILEMFSGRESVRAREIKTEKDN